MPLVFSKHPFPNATFGLWSIAEDESFFGNDLPLTAQESQELYNLKHLRRKEWLAARWLLHQFSGAPVRLPLAKDAFSKPFFTDRQQAACSLSHSQGVVGALFAEDIQEGLVSPAIGCDIQVMVEKMIRIAPKFINEPEWTFIQSCSPETHFDLYHIFWTAKESLYKAYGIKELDFRGHIHVGPFEWDGFAGSARARIEKGAYRQFFNLIFEKTTLPDERSLVWALCFPASGL